MVWLVLKVFSIYVPGGFLLVFGLLTHLYSCHTLPQQNGLDLNSKTFGKKTFKEIGEILQYKTDQMYILNNSMPIYSKILSHSSHGLGPNSMSQMASHVISSYMQPYLPFSQNWRQSSHQEASTSYIDIVNWLRLRLVLATHSYRKTLN